ncbi:MAG: RDD family protein [Spirochaetia bacterium]|nr:RDD family protein [Spirochaetia bacterium]
MLDTVYEVSVPEYVVFRFRTAGPAARFLAVLVDHLAILALIAMSLVLFGILSITAIFVGKDASGVAVFILFIMFFLIYWFYFFVFEWLNRGRTPGKMLLGLRVVSEDGTSLDVIQVMIRNLLRVADMFPFVFVGWLFFLPSYGTGFVALLSGPGFRRLGDLAAGTLVVREGDQRLELPEPVLDPRIDWIAERLQMRLLPSPTLVQSISDFVQSRSRLSPARRQEMAGRVESRIRHYFRAESLDCNAEELLMAVHSYLFRLPDKARASMAMAGGR